MFGKLKENQQGVFPSRIFTHPTMAENLNDVFNV